MGRSIGVSRRLSRRIGIGRCVGRRRGVGRRERWGIRI